MKATRLVLITVLFALFGCEKAGRTDKEGAEVEMNLHVYQEIKACGEDWWLINRVFPAFIGFDESDAAFWEQKWNITVDTEEELFLYNLNNDDDKSGILYTYEYSEGCNQLQPLRKEFYTPYTYDKAYVIYFHIPGKWIGEFPFRFRFENADTGEVRYSKEYMFITSLCSCEKQSSQHLFVEVFGCEKVDTDVIYAIQSGKSVSNIVCGDEEYSYRFDTQGCMSSILYNKIALEYAFEYQQDDKLVVTYGNYVNTYTYGQGKELLSIKMLFSGLDSGMATFEHSDGLPVTYSLSSETNPGYIVSRYTWDNGNLTKIFSEVHEDLPGSVLEFEYTDILNNLDIPVPFYGDWKLELHSDPFVYPLMRTKNLPRKISLSGYDSYITYSYEFNSDKDLIRVKADQFSEGKTYSKVYEIRYY